VLRLLLVVFCIIFSLPAIGITVDTLQKCSPSAYILKGVTEESEAMICCHGSGMDASIADVVRESQCIPYHLLAFNFPTYGSQIRELAPEKVIFGSIEELVPLLTLMRQCVVEAKIERLHLYGFSAGGGAIVNTLAILNKRDYPIELQKLGISEKERIEILKCVEKGIIILDCPLKSIEEIIALKGADDTLLLALQKKYAENQMRPIDAVQRLEGLSLNVFLHFETPDDKLSNRDDELYIQRLYQSNFSGQTHVIMGFEGKHHPCLPSLVQAISNLLPLMK